jgi:hypothetical protein
VARRPDRRVGDQMSARSMPFGPVRRAALALGAPSGPVTALAVGLPQHSRPNTARKVRSSSQSIRSSAKVQLSG